MRRKRSNSASKLRPANDVAQAMKSLAEWTGWSEQVCLNFLARSGWDALSGRLEKVSDYRSVMGAAREHHEAEVTSKRKLSVTAAKLREARRKLDAAPVAHAASAQKPRTRKKPFTKRSHHASAESSSGSKSAR